MSEILTIERPEIFVVAAGSQGPQGIQGVPGVAATPTLQGAIPVSIDGVWHEAIPLMSLTSGWMMTDAGMMLFSRAI